MPPQLCSFYLLIWIICIDSCYCAPINNNTMDIICSTQDDCFVSCQTNDCNHKLISCPDNLHRCHIVCENEYSCKNTIIMANNSAQLDITCNSPDSCSGITVYCPYVSPHSCALRINHNTNSNVTIHANNGWNAIQLLNYTQSTPFSGTLFCDSNSNEQCLFDLTQSNQCMNPNSACDDMYISTTIQIYQPTEHKTSISTVSTQNTTLNAWDILSQIHFLWWVILILITAICCLICILLIYMRSQHNYNKKLADVNRISQIVNSHSHSIAKLSAPPVETIIKLKSFSEEKSSATVTHIPLQASHSRQPLKRQSSVPIQSRSNHNNSMPQHTAIPFTRSKSHSIDTCTHTYPQHQNEYKSNIQMNVRNSGRSRAHTLMFTPRHEYVRRLPSIQNTHIQSNTNTTNTNTTTNTNNSMSPVSIDTETLSVVSGSSKSKGSLHNTHNNYHNNNNNNNNVPINQFYPQRSDGSNHSGTARQISYQQASQAPPQQIQRQQSQYATYNYSHNKYNKNNKRNNLHRQKSCPPAQMKQMQHMSYPLQRHAQLQQPPLRPIISQEQQSQSYNNENDNDNEMKEQKMEMPIQNENSKQNIMTPSVERNNQNLQYALQHLAQENKHLSPTENKHEAVNTLWTDASMMDAKSVLSLDNEPSAGIHGMLPGVFGNDDDFNDSD